MSSHSARDTSYTDFANWFLWPPALSCSCPAGHVRTWGNCEVWPLFTPGSQPERTKSPLTANTPLVHDSPFPHCQIEMYFSCITADSSWEIATKCRVYLWFYFPPAIYCTLNCMLKPQSFKEIIQRSFKYLGWRHKSCFGFTGLWNENLVLWEGLFILNLFLSY